MVVGDSAVVESGRVNGAESALALAADLAACLAAQEGSLHGQHRTRMDDAYLASPPADRAVAMAALAHPAFERHDSAAWFFYSVGGAGELERFCAFADLVLGHRDFLLPVIQAAYHAPDVVGLLKAVHDPESLFEHAWTPEEYSLVLRRRPDAAPLLWRRLIEEASKIDDARCLSILDSSMGVFEDEDLKAAFLMAAALSDASFFDEGRPHGSSWTAELLACGLAAPFWAVGAALADRAPELALRLADEDLPLEMALGNKVSWTEGDRRDAFLAAAARVRADAEARGRILRVRTPEGPCDARFGEGR